MIYRMKDYIEGKVEVPESVELTFPKTKTLMGHGRHGGGYIIICKICETPFFSYKKSKRYCNICKEIAPPVKPREKNMNLDYNQIRHRVCAYCGKEFETNLDYIKRGRGIYCSKECKAQAQVGNNTFVWGYTCVQCGAHYKSAKVTPFCSIECQNAYGVILPPDRAVPDNIELLAQRYHAHLKLQSENKKFCKGLITIGNLLRLFENKREII